MRAKKTAVSESNAIIEEDTINGLTPLAIAIGIMDSLPNGGNMYAGRNRRSRAFVSVSIRTIKNRKASIAPIGDANLNVPFSNLGVIRNTRRRIKIVGLLSFAGIDCVLIGYYSNTDILPNLPTFSLISPRKLFVYPFSILIFEPTLTWSI